MFGSWVRVVVLGLLAAASSATAQLVDLTGRPIGFDLVTLIVQTEVEAVVPVVNSFGNADLAALGNAWVAKFQTAAMDGTMTVQQNNADLQAFLAGAAALSPEYATSIRNAISKVSVNYATFHSFATAATWDAMEYGVTQSKLKYDADRLTKTRAQVVAGIKSGTLADLQLILNNYLTAEEKQNPGMVKAIGAAIEAVMKTVVEKNLASTPTVAPATNAPAAATPTTKPTSASSGATTMTEPPTVSPSLSIGGGSSALDVSTPVATSGESTPSSNTTTTTTNTTTAPTATEKSGASVAAALSAATGALVLVLTSALV